MRSGFDGKEFLEKLPFQVVPTNLPGADSVVAPRRPEEDDPATLEIWKKIFSRKWLAKDRIVPRMKVRERKTDGNKTFSNQQWAGSCIRGGTWQGVLGIWTIPAVSQPPQPANGDLGGWDSSSWVGLDGGNFGKKESERCAVDWNSAAVWRFWRMSTAPGSSGSRRMTKVRPTCFKSRSRTSPCRQATKSLHRFSILSRRLVTSTWQTSPAASIL